ncbi:hypothetical protein JTB14_018417 [Gonioctena quinquepunctata]|nr:hypothetical protein JTB14_018417 [Gonioctena quinquepunctata]
MSDEHSIWGTQTLRDSVIKKINECINEYQTNMTETTVELENKIFQKSDNKIEYLGYVSRLFSLLRTSKNNNENRGVVENITEKVTNRRAPKLVEIMSLEEFAEINGLRGKNVHNFLMDNAMDGLHE